MTDRQEYLDMKYAEVEDAPITGKPSKRHAPKKTDHKHTYRNCVLCWNGWRVYGKDGKYVETSQCVRYMLASYCLDCGKIGEYDKSDPFYKKMEKDAAEKHIWPLVFGVLPQQYIDAAVDVYPVFEVVDPFKDKFVSFRKDYS